MSHSLDEFGIRRKSRFKNIFQARAGFGLKNEARLKPAPAPNGTFGAWKTQGWSRPILRPNNWIDDVREWTIRLKSTHQSEPVNSFSLYKYFIRSGGKNLKRTQRLKDFFCANTFSMHKWQVGARTLVNFRLMTLFSFTWRKLPRQKHSMSPAGNKISATSNCQTKNWNKPLGTSVFT